MRWDMMSKKEQRIAEHIEEIYINNPSINKKEFLKSLFFIGNKHKKNG